MIFACVCCVQRLLTKKAIVMILVEKCASIYTAYYNIKHLTEHIFFFVKKGKKNLAKMSISYT